MIVAFERVGIFATGLGKPHRTNTGLVKCYRGLVTKVPATTAIGLYRWNDYDRILADLHNWKPKEIFFAGHSYGVSLLGDFVAKKLQQVWPHIRISDLLSADGVGRDCVDHIDKDSLDKDRKIVIPNNVDRLHTWRQRGQPISGHDFEISEPTQWVTNEWVDDHRHWSMDRVKPFLDLVEQLAMRP